jgi:phage FluMu gp28-like protein
MTTPTRQQKRTSARSAAKKGITPSSVSQSRAILEESISLVTFKEFQAPIFWDNETGVLCLHWSRQIGKSYVLSAWAVARLLLNPGRLVTVLSNSKDNGVEFIQKVKQVCELFNVAFEADDLPDAKGLAAIEFETMQFEVRIRVAGRLGRIKVLAANPRTARGFSGDLILDEFAFHADSVAIWDAAEPIISSNQDFLCRVASTGNGVHNMFYRMVAGASATASPVTNPAGLCRSHTKFVVSRVSRSAAHSMGQKIYDPKTRKPISPEDARKASLDKASYDQNYELAFLAAGSTLLNDDLVSQCEYTVAEADMCHICEESWSTEALAYFRTLPGPLILGQDVGRKRDLSVQVVGYRIGGVIYVCGILRMAAMSLPAQQVQLDHVVYLPNFGRAVIDETGLGIGLVDYAQRSHGIHRVVGVHFASREVRSEQQADHAEQQHGRNNKADTALVTELMALDVLAAFTNRGIRIPSEQALRDSLKKPQRISMGNIVKIAAETDEAGHADEFWGLALMVRGFKQPVGMLASTQGISIGGGRGGRERIVPRVLRSPALSNIVRGNFTTPTRMGVAA